MEGLQEKQTVFTKIKRFILECRRVLKVTKKPDREEFKTIVKASGIGMIIIGLVGFILQMIKQLLF
jgi:protein transport protein SEC61 subunit gamma-like protein